jgi:hypothetical protein
MILILVVVKSLKNSYEIRGEITAVFLKRKDGSILETLINTSDLERVKELPSTWCAAYSPITKSCYVTGKITCNGKRKNVRLHRWILDVADDLCVDHIDHQTLNNTKENLRILSTAENGQNRKPRKTISGIKGVAWKEANKKWQVQLMINRKKIYGGVFENLEDAKNRAIELYKKHMPFSENI